MNSLMTIQVRVIARDAVAQMAAIERQLQRMKLSNAGGGAGGTSFIDSAVNKIRGAFSAFEKFGSRIQSAGRQLTNSLTLPIGLLGFAAGKMAFENERAFTQLKKVYGLAGDGARDLTGDLVLLRRAFEALSDLYGVQQAQVIKIGALWAEAGDQGTSLAKSTRLTLDTMLLANVGYEEAAKSLITLRAAYGLSADGLKSALATINVIQATTSATFGDLIQAITRGGTAAITAGIDIQHFAAMVTTLVPAAGTAERAGNSLKTILSRLFAPSKQSQEMMLLLGIDTTKTAYAMLTGSQRVELLAQKFAGLSDAQKAMAASVIGTRFQFNSLATLLRDVNNPLGNYAKSLRLAGNEQNNLRIYAKELQTVLGSDPKAFEILFTRIKNGLAKAIIPMLPAIFDLMHGIEQLVTAFSGLDPKTQRFIMFSLAALAILGPIMRVVGGLIYVFSAFGKALLFPITSLIRLNAWMMRTFGVEGAGGMVSSFGRALIGGLSAVFSGASRLVAMGAGRVVWLWQQILLHAEPVFLKIGVALSTAFETGFALVQSGMRAIGSGVLTLWRAMAPAWAATGAFLAAAFETAFATITSVMATIGAAASVAFEAGMAAAAAIGPEILIGALIVGAVALLVIFREKVTTVMRSVLEWLVKTTRTSLQAIINFFGRLPGYIGDALVGVLRVVIAVGKAIYTGLRDALNPFQRHSPSLVDLVSLGVDIIARKYRSLRGIGADLRASLSDMTRFKAATKALSDDVQTADFNISLAKIAKNPKVPNARSAGVALIGNITALQGDLDLVTAAYARQQAAVTTWGRSLDRANASLQVQQDKLDRLHARQDALGSKLDDARQHLDNVTTAPLKGENAAREAIYQNELATKKWQLALSDLEKTYGSIDKLKDRLSALNGELELLRGSEASLRLKGAGSDVLGPLRAAEKALEGQRKNLGDVATKMTNYQETIDKLTTAGANMQLVFDATFGDMHHQIDGVANATKEISFKKAIAETHRWKPVVDALTIAYDNANEKIKLQQGIVTNLTTKRDAIQRSYDNENKKLTALGNLYDAINQQITDSTQLLHDLASSADKAAESLSAAFDAAGAGDFGLIPDKLSGIDKESLQKYIDDLEKETKKSFGKLDMKDLFTKPFKDAWEGVKNWWSTDVLGWWDRNVSWSAFSMPGGKWNVVEWFSRGWNDLKDWWTRDALPFLSRMGWDILDPFLGIPTALWKIIKGIGKIIIWPFQWAYDKLVGHSIIPELVNGIETWFKKLPGKILKAIGNLGRTLVGWAFGGALELFSKLGGVFAPIFTWFAGVAGRAWTAISTAPVKLGEKLIGLFSAVGSGIWSRLPGFFKGIFDWFGNLGSTIATHVGDLSGSLLGAGESLAGGIYKGIKNVVKGVGDVVGKIPVIGGPLKSVYDTVTSWPFATGGVAQPRVGGVNALIAEAGRPELVAPLPNGFSMMRLAATLDRVERFVSNSGNVTSMRPVAGKTELHFHGDLSFPNITDGSDAEDLIRNLEAMV